MITCYCDAGGNNAEGKDFYGSYKVNGQVIEERVDLPAVKTVNEAEYEIMIRLLAYLWINPLHDDITIHSDSRIVVNQVNRVWRVNAKNLVQFWLEATGFLTSVKNNNRDYKTEIIWVPREIIVEELGH